MLIPLFILPIGMKYAVVWMKKKQKGTKARQEAIFYNMDDAVLWEQHINMTLHAKTELHPIWGDSWGSVHYCGTAPHNRVY